MKKLLTFVLLTCMLALAVGTVMAQAPQTAVGMGDLQPLEIQPNYMQGGAIQFALGATSAVVNGYVQQNASISYTIYAMQGQNFILLLSSDSGIASLSVSDVYGNSYAQAYEGRTYFNMVLPRTATYNVNVNAVGAASNYSLQVFIPAKVQIPLGQRSVSYNGTVSPYGGSAIPPPPRPVRLPKLTVTAALSREPGCVFPA